MNDQINKWSLVHAVFILICFLAYVQWGQIGFMAIPSASFLYLVWITRMEWKRIRFGLPNTITALRLLLCVALIFLFKEDIYMLLGIAIPIAVLDGLDGYFARKLNQQTIMGAQLDKEVDAYYILILAILVLENSIAGFWVLGFGLIRYIYVIVGYRFRKKSVPEMKFGLGRIIAVATMIILMAAQILPTLYATIILITGFSFLLYSFVRSAYYQFRT
ncbi:MAG: CDP-alcohol phosphatidyltransferase family protein [Bacteroidota bacterium]